MRTVIAFVALFLLGCDGKKDEKAETPGTHSTPKIDKPVGEQKTKPADEPDRVTVQHILIAFNGAARPVSKPIKRTRDEALKLANELMERAKKNESFDDLVAYFTDDSPPGIYAMANYGVAKQGSDMDRGGLVPAFGNVGFKLKVGEVGLADYHSTDSPYGWHIIKRIK